MRCTTKKVQSSIQELIKDLLIYFIMSKAYPAALSGVQIIQPFPTIKRKIRSDDASLLPEDKEHMSPEFQAFVLKFIIHQGHSHLSLDSCRVV
jgi:hypothetical protein